MAITNYLVHFTTEATYNNKKSELRNDAVAFVKDATIIHTHGTDYYCGSGPVALESDLANYATTSALTSGLAGKANTSHTHSISQISGLQSELDSKLESVSLADLGITATAAELNKLDGCTATVTELNYVDGVTSNIQTQLNGKAASTHTHSASDIKSGTLAIARIPTGSTASTVALGNHTHGTNGITALTGYTEGSSTTTLSSSMSLNTALASLQNQVQAKASSLSDLGITATAAEINKLDGLTATTTELNYIDGVTSNIQTQLNNKAASSHNHSAANITSGTLDIARLPSITDAKITSVSASKITGTIPQANLPSYVDDVLEYSSKSSFPQTGETGKIYVDTATNLTYRWGGSSYVEISPSIAIGETSSTAYRGDRGKIAYDHSQATGNPHNLTLANLGINATATELNYMDGVTSSVQTQLNGKAATSHNHNASNINAGVLNIARIPTGTSATTVALGNHTHSWSSITGKPSTFTPSAHTHGSDDVTALTGYSEGTATTTLSSSMSLNTALASLQNQIQTKQAAGSYAAASHTHSAATTSAGGFMSAADKAKLDGITASADSVSIARNLTSGTPIASITINGTNTVLYAPTNTDTKNTTGTSNSVSKLYLAGGTSQSSTGVTTYSNSSVYTQSGELYAYQMNATNGFYETSDARLKNFKDDIKALDVVSEIPTKYFT